ncbi:MAG: hypothetical protein A3K65_08455 [Euryarchaeota archaeon RBG_16_68_12]|nr:MAG: hypothetical protein A3K65_08455 [Euryarchaeota archaeon RBG_16_68_12]
MTARARPGAILPEILRSLGHRPATEPYPYKTIEVPAGFRGRIEVAEEKCIGCSKCAIVCPTECIEMVAGERDVTHQGRILKRKRKPVVHLLSCIRCGLCEDACPTDPKAIFLTEKFSGAYTERDVIVG